MYMSLAGVQEECANT